MKENIINDYVNNYLGTMEIAHKYNIHRSTVQKYLINGGIKLRKKTPEIRVNHFYFSKYTEENCYWAGFILADGYIRQKNRFTLEIKLQKGDVDHLYKFKKSIEYDGRVIERETYYSITISSQQLIKDLAQNFDIFNKKSLTCCISDKIPQKFLREYIRGYFDGDGCISYTTMDTISFLGTEKTINFIRNYFYEIVDVRLKSKDMPNIILHGNIFTIYYYGKPAFKCLNHLYKNSKMFLDRKYIKYYNLIKKYIPKNE
jgi:DNA-binding transcriptional regulator WhiA